MQGSIYFSSKTFNNNPNGWNDSLRNNYYRYPALVPPMKWIDNVPPLKPLIETLANKDVRVIYRGAEPIKSFAIFIVPAGAAVLRANATLVKIMVATKTIDINISSIPARYNDRIFIAAVDRNNNLSEWVQLK